MDFKDMELWLDVTHDCNLACKYCYRTEPGRMKLIKEFKCVSLEQRLFDEVEKTGYMNTDQIKHIISQFKECNGTSMVISGGEPLKRRDILEIFKHANRLGVDICLTTNGTLIDDGLARKIIEYDIRTIQIKADGNEKTQDTLSGRGTFKKIQRGISNINKYKKSERPHLLAIMVLSKYNLDQVEDVVKICIDSKVTSLHFQPLFPGNTSFYNKFHLTKDDVHVVSKIRELKKQYKDRIIFDCDQYIDNLELFIKTGRRPVKYCMAGKKFVYCDPFGRLFLCPFNWKYLGDLTSQNIEEIPQPNNSKSGRMKACERCYYTGDNFHTFCDK